MIPQVLQDKIYKIKNNYDSLPIRKINGKYLSYPPDELQEKLAEVYAESIRDNVLKEYKEVNWKAELGCNLYATNKMMLIIGNNSDKKIKTLRAIVYSWCKTGTYQDKFTKGSPEYRFLEKIIDTISNINMESSLDHSTPSEYRDKMLKMFKNDRNLLETFIKNISSAKGSERKQNIICKHIWYLMVTERILYTDQRDVFKTLSGAGYYEASESAFNAALPLLDYHPDHSPDTLKKLYVQISQYYN